MPNRRSWDGVQARPGCCPLWPFFWSLLCWSAASTETLIFLPILIALLVVYLALHRFGPNLGAWGYERLARKDGILREQVLTAASDCFRAESERGKTEVKWSAVPRIHVEGERLFVYSTPRLAFIVPQRAFADDAHFEAFVEAVRRYWEQHHRL